MTLSPAAYRTLADAVVVFHFGFVLFVVLGGLLVLRWRRAMWIHLPCAAWGALIEIGGWVCPLTPLEHRFRDLGHEPGYAGSFVDHYVVSVLYPAGLTRGFQYAIAAFVIVLNVVVYSLALRRARARPLRPA